MRSSKSRSRSKQNRPRSIGNIVNRVFDSSGPEGKVRGTPQQIIEKYQTLARDAQLSNDRVAAENFLQHAEHYTRMLSEAMRELAAEQDSRRNQGHQGNGNGHGNGQGGHDRAPYGQRRDDRAEDDQPDVGGAAFGFEDGSSALVETPEARVEQPARQDHGRDGNRRQEYRREDRRDDNRREDRRDDNRRDGRPDNRRDDNRRDDRQDNRRDDNRREDRQDNRRDDNRREDRRPAPVRAEPAEQPVVVEAPVAEFVPAPVVEPAVVVTEVPHEVQAEDKPKPKRAPRPRKPAEKPAKASGPSEAAE